MESGIEPVKRLLVREMTLRFLRLPSWAGIGPVTMPGFRTSWLSSVRLEMDGEREPASPREPDRPVPRMSEVTRLGFKNGDEQVMPAKVEQGS